MPWHRISELRLRTFKWLFGILRDLSAVVIFFYVFLCLWQFNETFFTVEIERILVVSADKKVGETKDPSKRLVHSGDMIEAYYKVEHFVPGTGVIERFLVTPEGRMVLLESINRSYVMGKTTSISHYQLPRHLEPGCGYYIFSRNNITIDYNIVSQLTKKVIDAPKIEFCVAK